MKLKDIISAGMLGHIRVINIDSLDEYYRGPAKNLAIHVPKLLEYEVYSFYSSANLDFFRTYGADTLYTDHSSYITITVNEEA